MLFFLDKNYLELHELDFFFFVKFRHFEKPHNYCIIFAIC